MKRSLFLLVAAAVLTACAPAVPAGEFRIVGKIENVPDSAVIYLYETRGRILREIAVDTLFDGAFSFRDTVSVPKVVQLYAEGEGYPNWLFEIWVAPGKRVDVKGRDKMIGLWDVSSGILEQHEENDYLAHVVPEMREMMLLMATAPDEPFSERKDSLYKALFNLITDKTLRHMQTAPVTAVWMNRLVEYAGSLQYGIGIGSKAEMLALCDRMTEKQRHSRKGRSIEAYLNPPPAVSIGDAMADGDLYDTNGSLHHLADFSGKYILLDFWSQGCGPCIQAIPELRKIETLYAGRVEVVSISQDPEAEWKTYVAVQKLTGNQWNELLDGNTGLGAQYRVRGIPHFVLIAPDGRIRDVWTGYGKGSLLEKLKENIE